MKKLFVVLSLLAFAPCVFAGVNKGTLNRAVTKTVDNAEAQRGANVDKLTKAVKADLAQFKKAVADKPYYDANFIFQAMDNLRVSYMELHKVSAAAAQGLAKEVNAPIAIANGNTIRIEAYVRMETVSLYPTEQEKFDAFGAQLEKDLAATSGQTAKAAPAKVALPKNFAEGLANFRAFVQNMKKENASFVIQQATTACMDEYNEVSSKVDAATRNAMLKEFAKPIEAGWGKTIQPARYIKANLADVVYPGSNTYTELDDFADAVLNAK